MGFDLHRVVHKMEIVHAAKTYDLLQKISTHWNDARCLSFYN